MTAEQNAYLVTCGLMFLAGFVVLGIGVAVGKVADPDADWPVLVIGIGLLCMTVGPLMLIGFPS